MTTAEVEALLRLLAEMEREEMELLMRERREAEREGRPHEQPDRGHVPAFLCWRKLKRRPEGRRIMS
jgi:hypothetical protein